MGELGYYSLVGQLISEDEAKRVAPEWRGDRYLVYENAEKHQYALVARTGGLPGPVIATDLPRFLPRAIFEISDGKLV